MALSGSRRRTPLLGPTALFLQPAALLLPPALPLAPSSTGIASGAQPPPHTPTGVRVHPQGGIAECPAARAFTPPPPPITTHFRPRRFYDEAGVLHPTGDQPGDAARLPVPADSNAAWTVIDLVDFQAVD